MANPQIKQENLAHHTVKFATGCESIVEDVVAAVLGFIPNGLDLTYNHVLKPMPVLGKFFSHRWVEQVCKLCTGTTIGQGLATDIAYFVFRPLGYALGFLLARGVKKELHYQGEIGKFLYRISGQVVSGALLGILLALMLALFSTQPLLRLRWELIALFASCGGAIGLASKLFLLMAIRQVNASQMEDIRKNVQRAKELGNKLKKAARQRAKSLILRQAQDIIQQMNGPQSQQYLEEFFNQSYEVVSSSFNQKIDRHFNYLVDRACHGDVQSLKRLQDLIPSRVIENNTRSAFEIMINRIFNARAILKLKDDVDTAYDRWQYEFLRVKEVG